MPLLLFLALGWWLMLLLHPAADSPDFKPRVNWSRFHETMSLAEMAQDPYALSPTAVRMGKPSMTHSDGVNGPADITGVLAVFTNQMCSLMITTAESYACSFQSWTTETLAETRCGLIIRFLQSGGMRIRHAYIQSMSADVPSHKF